MLTIFIHVSTVKNNMLTIPDGRYEITKLYCIEEILMFYSAYIENLKRCPFKQVIINPNDIMVNIEPKRIWEEAAQSDMYLDKYKNEKTMLANDMKENGMYFPFWGYYSNNKFNVLEGLHRIESIKMYIDAGNEWDYNVMAFIVPENYYDRTNFKEYVNKIYFPVYNIENNWHNMVFGTFCKTDEENIINYNNTEKDCALLINTYTEQDFSNAMFAWHKFLRNIFFKYQECTGKRIPVSKYINLERKDIKDAF